MLEECGINVTKVNKEELIKTLEEMRDLSFKTQAEELIWITWNEWHHRYIIDP